LAKKNKTVVVNLDAFVPSGQTIGELDDGRKIFVWGGLPGEECKVAITKSKTKFAQGIVVEVIQPSKQRVEPKDGAFLSTSPWQIVPWKMENTEKHRLLKETFAQQGIEVEFDWHNDEQQWAYRNKMEFSFWWDHDTGLELAFHMRGARHRLPVEGSSLAMEEINRAARGIRDALRVAEVEARVLKTLMLRADRNGSVYAALFVKDKDFQPPTDIEKTVDGLKIYFSNPKSPASVSTKLLHAFGEDKIVDKILDTELTYSVESFFQVNIPVFEQALRDIKKFTTESDATSIVDLYSGVGSIGLSVGAHTLVDSDTESIRFAKMNAANNETVIHSTSEQAVEHINSADILIVDPPRAGLHGYVTDAIEEYQPRYVVYLSCNPATQARDIGHLGSYKITAAKGYNFFPKTPHIESLVILEKT